MIANLPNAFIVPRSARRQKCVNRKPNVRYKRYPIQLRRNVTFSPQLHKRDAAHTSHVFVMLLDLFLEHLIDQRVGTKTILLNHNRSFMCYSPYSKKSRYRRTGTQNATLKLCQVEHFAFSFVFWAGRDCKFRHTFGFFLSWEWDRVRKRVHSVMWEMLQLYSHVATPQPHNN